ncbi:MAG: PAS domain-containing protein [Bryobacteraceae bacterium]|nr:PAS domain-containing protein [Bryobacteraceae bacterium]
MRGYVVAAVALIVAVAANNATAPHLRANTIWTALPYLVALAVAAWRGYGPGLFTVVCIRFLIPLTGLMKSTTIPTLNWPGISVIVVTSLLVSRLAAQLRESEERLRDEIRDNTAELEMLYSKLPVGLCFLDREFRFRRINETLAAVNGRRPEEHLGLTVDEVLPPVVASWVKPVYEQVLATGRPVHNFEFEAASVVDGSMRWWNINCAPVLAASGEVSGLQIVVLDVTERYEAARALTRANEELRRVNDDLSQFAYIAAHDLQEPLRTVITFSQLVQRQCKGRLDGNTDRHLDFIVSAGQRMGQLIADVLAYSSMGIDDNRQPEEVALTELVASISEHMAGVECGDLPVVVGYPRQIQQVFQNLTGNAFKYSRPGVPSHIIISAMRESPQFWRLTVADNGQGFKQEYAERIFGIFRRLHGKDVPGSGIGLAICKRVVERHGGRIWAESTPGQGATFHFTLPARSD